MEWGNTNPSTGIKYWAVSHIISNTINYNLLHDLIQKIICYGKILLPEYWNQVQGLKLPPYEKNENIRNY